MQLFGILIIPHFLSRLAESKVYIFYVTLNSDGNVEMVNHNKL